MSFATDPDHEDWTEVPASVVPFPAHPRSIRARLAAVPGRVRSSSRDLMAIGGVGCLAYGAAQINAALPGVVVGVFLLIVAGAGRAPGRPR